MPLSDAWKNQGRYYATEIFGSWSDGMALYPAQETAPDRVEFKQIRHTYPITDAMIRSCDEPDELDPELVLAAIRRMSDDQLRRLNQILDHGRRGSDFLFLPSRDGGFLEPLGMNARRK